MRMESHKNLIFKSVITFDPLHLESNKSNHDIFLDDNDNKKILAKSKNINPIEEEIKKIEKNLHLTKRNYAEYSNTKLLAQIDEDILSIESILEEGNQGLDESAKITFLNVICFILKKINKKTSENEILKTYFLSFDKLVHLFLPLNVNLNDMMTRLSGQIKYEKKFKNRILFKEGDKGDKFYIILKGEVGILIPQEKIIKCCPSEYLKYLICLYLYQEKSLINKLLLVNRETLKFDERIFDALMDGLKFYHFFIMYSGTKKAYKNPLDFLHQEIKINNYIRKKNDFSPEQAFYTLNLANISEDIYEYYSDQMENINSIFLTNVKNKVKTSGIFSVSSPNNLSEFGQYIKENEHDKKKLKENEFFDKLYHVNELNSKDTIICTTEEYIKRVNCEKKIKEITSDIRNNVIKINEKDIELKYFNYLEVNQLRDKNIFGELALINPNQKRTATIIMKENCHFGVLDKESYEISIKTAQEKSRTRNLLYFTNGFLFKGLTNNYFLNNYFFRFKKKIYNSGEYLFRRGEQRTKLFFIINGELQLGGKMTLKKISEIIRWLQGETGWDDGGVIVKHCKESVDFRKFYEEAQNYFRFYVLKKKEIAGLDDMTEDGIFLFDCVANSLEPTEVYEFDYSIYETCLKEKIVQINNDNYVSTKKKLLIDRLYKQRDSIANNEFSRIKIYILNNENLKNNEIKRNMDVKNKKEKYKKNCFSLNNIFFNKNIFSSIEDNKTNTNNINNDNNYLARKLPTLYTTGNFNNIKGPKSKLKLYLERTEYNEANTLNQQNSKSFRKSMDLNQTNSKSFRKSIESNYSTNINFNPLLVKFEKNSQKREKSIACLLKSENINLSKIAFYLNKNNISLPKFKRNSVMNNEQKPNLKFNKSSNKKQNETIIESNNIKDFKKKFVFNNQKIFSLLLNSKDLDSNKNSINYTLQSQQNFIKDYENKRENLINEKFKVVNTEIKDSNKMKRNKRKTMLSLGYDNDIKKSKYLKSLVDENYKKIFLIDCLCLDNWEEKNNKYKKKIKAKLKGKKITYH